MTQNCPGQNPTPHSAVETSDGLLQVCREKAELARGLRTAGKAVIWARKRNDIVISQLMSAKIGNIYPKTGLGGQSQQTPMGTDADERVSLDQGNNDG